MTRSAVLNCLEVCERHIEQCERDLAQQRELIGALKRDGHRTLEAVTVLERIELALYASSAERERLLRAPKE